MERVSYDVVVCGGGLAGVCAALSAARSGLKTSIIQDRPVFGGNSSSEVRVGIGGAADANPWARETGIIEELFLSERFQNFTGRMEGEVNSMWDLILYDACKKEKNLSIYLNSTVKKVKKERNKINKVIILQLLTEKVIEIEGDLFVDATGDGVIAYLANAEYRMGRESKKEFKEELAPEEKDNFVMGSTLLFSVKDIRKPINFTAPRWAKKYKDDDIKIRINPHSNLPNYWWLEIGFPPYDVISDNEIIRDELLKNLLGLWEYIKKRKDFNFRNYALDWIGMLPGKRESRRVIGDYVLNEKDLRYGKIFNDAIAYGGYYIDLHVPGGILTEEESLDPTHVNIKTREKCLVPIYSIPLRSVYSKDIENLFLAGRDISVTHVALGSTRVMATCAVIGQAVGLACYICKKYNILPKEFESKQIKILQQEIIKSDCYIPNVRNEDEFDLAKIADIETTSCSPLIFKDPAIPKKIDRPLGQIFPVSTDRINVISLYLETVGKTEVILRVRKVESVWDYKDNKDIVVNSVKLNGKFKGWVDFILNIEIKPKSLYWVILDKNPNVIVYGNNLFKPVGVVPVHKPYNAWEYFKEDNLKGFEKNWYITLNIEPIQFPYEAENIISGVTRSDYWTNIWISDPKESLPQSIILKYKKPITFNTIYLTFDTNLNLNHFSIPSLRGIRECVRHYRVYFRDENKKWIEIVTIRNNYLRRRIHKFDQVISDIIKIEIISTWGCPSAHVFEVRIYQEK